MFESSSSSNGLVPIENESNQVDLNEISSIVNDIHLPEHDKFDMPEQLFDDELAFESPDPVVAKTETMTTTSSPMVPMTPPDSATLNGENIVKGHLVTLRQKDGKENVYFLDPQGQLHPVIGAQLKSPVGSAVVKVKAAALTTSLYIFWQNTLIPNHRIEHESAERK